MSILGSSFLFSKAGGGGGTTNVSAELAGDLPGEIIIGEGAFVSASGGIAIGLSSFVDKTNAANVSGQGGVAIGWGAKSHQSGVGIGLGVIAGTSSSNDIGCIAIGVSSFARNRHNIAIGYKCGASGTNAFAFGDSCSVGGDKGIAVGNNCIAGESLADDRCIAFGDAVRVGIGTGNLEKSFGIGNLVSVHSQHAIAFGVSAVVCANSDYSIAIGDNAHIGTSASAAIVIGQNTSCGYAESIVIGNDVAASATNQFTFGDKALRLGSFGVTVLPTASEFEGHLVYCSNGDSGSPCLAVSDGVDWNRITLGAAVTVA